MDLPSLVRQYASDTAVEALSNTLGEPIQRVSAATSAAVPTLLSCYADKVTTPAGADEVYEALHERGPSLLDHLPDSLSGSSAHGMMDEGSQQVTRLFGRDSLDGLAHAISRFSGLGISSARSVLGALNAITLATISKHAAAENGHDVASYLGENRPSISEAVPAGLHEYLDEIPSIRRVVHHYDDGVSATATDDAMQDEAEISRQENYHNEKYYGVDQGETDRAAGLAWVVPLLIVVAIGAALIYTLMPRETSPTQQIAVTPPAPLQGQVSTPEVPVDEAQPAGATLAPDANALMNMQPEGDPQIGRDLASQVQQFSKSLQQIRDSGNADAAQQDLQRNRESIKQIRERFTKLPQEQQRQVATVLNQQLPSLRTRADQATVPADANARASSARPVVDDILRELQQMAQTGR